MENLMQSMKPSCQKVSIDTTFLKNDILSEAVDWAVCEMGQAHWTLLDNDKAGQSAGTGVKRWTVFLADSDKGLAELGLNSQAIPTEPEALVIGRMPGKENCLLAYGADVRGLVYAVTELTDRFRHATSVHDDIVGEEPVIERPAMKIRSISKCFESDTEDLDWFHDREMWQDYLSMLITQRFNRLTLTLGMQYNYPYGNEFLMDVYLYFAYPFLVSPDGFNS
jgi:hypothetical protein